MWIIIDNIIGQKLETSDIFFIAQNRRNQTMHFFLQNGKIQILFSPKIGKGRQTFSPKIGKSRHIFPNNFKKQTHFFLPKCEKADKFFFRKWEKSYTFQIPRIGNTHFLSPKVKKSTPFFSFNSKFTNQTHISLEN